MTALLVRRLVLLLACYGLARAQRSKGRNIPVGSDVKASVNFDCPEEFGYYPHPTDCTQYYVCVFGGALLESCTGGLMYSHELQTCDWPRNVGCDALGQVSATSSGGGVSASVQSVSRVPEQRVRYTVASPTPAPPSQPAAVVTSRGQSRQLHHTQEIINKQKQQQQLYAEADDVLPPAEEIENDRQQRVYRGQPSTLGQVQRDRDGLRHTNAIPTSSRGEKISVISFGTQQQQPIQYRNYTLYTDDSLTNYLTEKRRRKRQVRRRLPAIELINNNGDTGVSWQTRHAPHILYQPTKQTHQNLRPNSMNLHLLPAQRTRVPFKPSYQQTEFSPVLPLQQPGDQTEFQPFSPNPLAYKTAQVLKVYPYNNAPIVKQPPVTYQYYDYNTNKPEISIKKTQNLTDNYAYFNLGDVVTIPTVAAQIPHTQGKAVQVYYKPIIEQVKPYNENNSGISVSTPVQYVNNHRIENHRQNIRKPVTYKPQHPEQPPQPIQNNPETYYNQQNNQKQIRFKPKVDISSNHSQEKKDKNSEEENENIEEETDEENDDKEEEEEDDDDDEEEEESSDKNDKKENVRDLSIKPDFPTPPPFFSKSTNKYEHIDNPFADPNFDFDKFLSKLKGPENLNPPKQVTTEAKYQTIAAQNDSKEKMITSKIKPEDLDLRTPIAFSSPAEKNDKPSGNKLKPVQVSDDYYYDDSVEEEEIPEKNKKPFNKLRNEDHENHKSSERKQHTQNKHNREKSFSHNEHTSTNPSPNQYIKKSPIQSHRNDRPHSSILTHNENHKDLKPSRNVEYNDKRNKNIKSKDDYDYYDYYDYPDSEEKQSSQKNDNNNEDEGRVTLQKHRPIANDNRKQTRFRESPPVTKDNSKKLSINIPNHRETALIRPTTYENILYQNGSYMEPYQKRIKNTDKPEFNQPPSTYIYQKPLLTSTVRSTETTLWITTNKTPGRKSHSKTPVRQKTTTFRPYRDLDITKPQNINPRNSSKLEETNVSPQSHSISSVQSTTAGRTLYNGSQHYDPAQYDPYYPIYEDDVELYRDVDYTQQYTSNRAQPPSTQHTYRGTPAPISIPVQSTVQQEPTPQRGSTYIQSGYSTQAQDIYSRPSAQDYHDDNYNTQVDDQTSYRQSSRQPSRGDRNELSYFVETSPKSTTTIRTTTTTTTTLRPIPVQKQTAVPSRSPIIATANQTRPQSIIITLSATPGQNSPKTHKPINDVHRETINSNNTSDEKMPSRLISLRTDFSLGHKDNKQSDRTEIQGMTQTQTLSVKESENHRPVSFTLTKLPTAEMKSVVFQLSSRLSNLTPNVSDESDSYSLSHTHSIDNSNKKSIQIDDSDLINSTRSNNSYDAYFEPTTYAPKLISLASVLTPQYLNTQSINALATTEDNSRLYQRGNTALNKPIGYTTTDRPRYENYDKPVKTVIRKTPITTEQTTTTYPRRNRTDRKIISKIHFGFPQANIEQISSLATTLSPRIRIKETHRFLEPHVSSTEPITSIEYLSNRNDVPFRTTKHASITNENYFIPITEQITSPRSQFRFSSSPTQFNASRTNRMILAPQTSVNLNLNKYKSITSTEKFNVVTQAPISTTTAEFLNPYLYSTTSETSNTIRNLPNIISYTNPNRFSSTTDRIANIFPQFRFSAKYPYSVIERPNGTLLESSENISLLKKEASLFSETSTTAKYTTTSTSPTTEYLIKYTKSTTSERPNVSRIELSTVSPITTTNRKLYTVSDVTSPSTLVPHHVTEKYQFVKSVDDANTDSERVRSQLLENRNVKPFRATAELPNVSEILATQNEPSKKETDLPPTYKPKPILVPIANDLTNKTMPADQSRSFSLPVRISRVNTAIKSLIAFGGTRRNSQSPKCNENQTRPDTKCNEIQKQRTSSRARGSAHYTNAGASDTVTANRGTPATRFRPTLKPSTSIVSKASEYIDIYKYPPHRPDPIYPQPQVDKTAAKCRKDVCLLPDCSCGGKEIPGDLPVEQVPQIVLLTFDDSVNDLNKGLYVDLFEKGRTNPNGCPIAATFYVSHEWTDYSQVQNLYSDGHEIASHTVSHSFGEQFSQKKWNREVAGQREILAAYGGVHLEDVRGMRAPFLSVGGNKMFKMLYDSNFTFDSSLPVYENRPPSWPYTLDYKLFHDCMIPPCPTRSYPGVWEVPMVMWQDLNGGRCSMGDACSNPGDSDGVYKMLMKNFERHYTTNRAPFGLFYHAAWFTQPHHKEGFIRFLDFLVSKDDVFLVTNWQAIEWVRDPTPLSRIKSFQPFQCNYSDRPKRCNNPKVCNLWHKSGVRYMKTCQPCPDIYPWTGKTGIRSSRIDNDIED